MCKDLFSSAASDGKLCAAIAFCWPSVEVLTDFGQSHLEAVQARNTFAWRKELKLAGVITRMDANDAQHVLEINGQPAGQVYAEWVQTVENTCWDDLTQDL